MFLWWGGCVFVAIRTFQGVFCGRFLWRSFLWWKSCFMVCCFSAGGGLSEVWYAWSLFHVLVVGVAPCFLIGRYSVHLSENVFEHSLFDQWL